MTAEPHEELRKRWLNVVAMHGRHSAAPLAPRWGRFLETGENGLGWLDLMERWERDSWRGETPIDFEKYVAYFLQAPGPDS